MAAHRIAFPDKHTEIRLIVADDEIVACHCTVTATHTGQYSRWHARLRIETKVPADISHSPHR